MARVLAASGDAADIAVAARTLQSLLDEMSRKGLVALQLEVRLALGEMEIRANNFKVAHTQLLRLKQDAQQKAFPLAARAELFSFLTPCPTASTIRPASSTKLSGRELAHQSGLVIVATRLQPGLCTTRRDGGMLRATRGGDRCHARFLCTRFQGRHASSTVYCYRSHI
jgi:hypothetical protein